MKRSDIRLTREEFAVAAVNGGGGECLIRVFVQPRAGREGVVGLHDGELKIAVTAPPVDGEANRAVCEFLAKSSGVAKGRVTVKRGETSRHKLIAVAGIEVEDLINKLMEK
ncbi:MAG: DUF167 family protein [Victivallaceae bacterium]|nr:DUF167 family protein [Victivallaceae bacterium]